MFCLHVRNAYTQPIIESGAADWRKRGLPIGDSLLQAAAGHLKLLAVTAASRALSETTLMYKTGFRAVRGKQLMQYLQQALTGLCVTGRSAQDDPGAVDILGSAVDVCTQFLQLAADLFDTQTHAQSQRIVQTHFEAQLKLISQLNTLATVTRKVKVVDSTPKARMFLRPRGGMPPPPPPLPTFQAQTKSKIATGLLDKLDDAVAIQDRIMTMMRRLMEHIVQTSHPLLTEIAGAGGAPREMVLWLMYSANFVNRILVMLGPDRIAGDDEMKSVLEKLKYLEGALPTSL